jgi:hypothetical protein
MKQPNKYGMVQIPEDVHKRLKEYCNKHGFVIGGFVAALIRQAIHKG